MTGTQITDFEAVAPMPIYTQADLDAAVQKDRAEILKLIEELDEPPYRGYENPNTWDDALVVLSAMIRERNKHD